MTSQLFSEEYLRYERLCEEEVIALTGIEFDTWDPEGPPPSLDPHFREGSGWSFGGSRKNSLLFVKSTFTDHGTLLHNQSV